MDNSKIISEIREDIAIMTLGYDPERVKQCRYFDPLLDIDEDGELKELNHNDGTMLFAIAEEAYCNIDCDIDFEADYAAIFGKRETTVPHGIVILLFELNMHGVSDEPIDDVIEWFWEKELHTYSTGDTTKTSRPPSS